MSKGILLFCFDTEHTRYHNILEKCVALIRKNLKLEITVVTNFDTFKKMKPMGFINYKFIKHTKGNTKLGKEWNNVGVVVDRTSMMQYSNDSGCRAYWMLHSPTIPKWRTTRKAADLSMWYSSLLNV